VLAEGRPEQRRPIVEPTLYPPPDPRGARWAWNYFATSSTLALAASLLMASITAWQPAFLS
jgi:hypothetical protein